MYNSYIKRRKNKSTYHFLSVLLFSVCDWDFILKQLSQIIFCSVRCFFLNIPMFSLVCYFSENV